ncbi:hypothetical protein OIE66_02180 [Nonomuraea sp. NBC_01738]|nr:hypothetical protein OIE66_02180 [Nonomuraea sp. NBC_01738]
MEVGYIAMVAIGLFVVGFIGIATVVLVLRGIKGGQWPTLKR